MRNHSGVCLIDKYDDLLLPGHRFLAQMQVFASGESPNAASEEPRYRAAQVMDVSNFRRTPALGHHPGGAALGLLWAAEASSGDAPGANTWI